MLTLWSTVLDPAMKRHVFAMLCDYFRAVCLVLLVPTAGEYS